MKIAILGGGFGLYGYLPAAISIQSEVHLLYKYRVKLQSRKELCDLISKIVFHKDEKSLLQSVETLIIARMPQNQEEVIRQLPKNISELILEKPLTKSSANHRATIELLKGYDVHFAVDYLFLYSNWFGAINELIQNKEPFELEIKWKVPFPRSDWKTSPTMGGGLFDYYAIHYLPIFYGAGFDYSEIEIVNEHETIEIRGVCGDQSMPSRATASVSYDQNASFEVGLSGSSRYFNWSNASPFGALPQPGVPDPRITPLAEFLQDIHNKTLQFDYVMLEKFVCSIRETFAAKNSKY